MGTVNANYESTFAIPYSSTSRCNTIDVHRRIHGLEDAGNTVPIWVVYIHGGAFRDPDQTSLEIMPTVPLLLGEETGAAGLYHVEGVVAVNYRLSAYPGKLSPEDEQNCVIWPTHIEDVCAGITFAQGLMLEQTFHKGNSTKYCAHHVGNCQWLLCGHSVGATMAIMLALQAPLTATWKVDIDEDILSRLVGVVALEGIYDFVACRDAHLVWATTYNDFTTAAFGLEESGGWESGNLIAIRPVARSSVKVIVIAQSEADDLVEYAQGSRMAEALLDMEPRSVNVSLFMVEGTHQGILEKGYEVVRSIKEALRCLS